MHSQRTLEESELSPSFNCYSSDSLTSRSIAKVISEQQAVQFHENDDVSDEDFEFSVLVTEEHASVIDSSGLHVFPVFNRDLIVNDDVDREIRPKIDENREINANDDVDCEIKHKVNENDENYEIEALQSLFVDDADETSSYSSSEVDELENLQSGTFCVWRPKVLIDGEPSPVMTKCKKSSSTGSGSKQWRIRYLLRRSNSEGKEPMVMFSAKQKRSSGDVLKEKRNSGEVSGKVLKVAGRWKAGMPVHERFYVQRRAENEVGKRKSYLPYRKDLVGLFGNVNGLGKMLPF